MLSLVLLKQFLSPVISVVPFERALEQPFTLRVLQTESGKTSPFPSQCVNFSFSFFLFNPGQVRDSIKYERYAGVSKIMTIPLLGIQNPGLFLFLVDSTPAEQGCSVQLPCFLIALSAGTELRVMQTCSDFPTASSWSR